MSTPIADWYYRDNRFSSVAHQRRVHRPIVELAARMLGDRGGNVLDLGCGNAALLQAIHQACPAAVPYGIDLVPGSIAHARALLPEFRTHFLAGDLFDAPDRFDDALGFAVVGLNPRRMVDANPAHAERLKDWLRARSDQMLVYAYGSGLTGPDGLAGFARRVGIEIVDTAPDTRASPAQRF